MAQLESADNVKLHGDQTIDGVKTFLDSPIVPAPSGPTSIVTKQYVDDGLDLKLDANVPVTGATKTKITYDADGLITSGTDATTADIADSSNKRYVTDANLIVIGNTSGVNTGNQTTTAGLANSADKNLVTDAQLVVIGNTSGTNTGDQNLTPYFNKSVDDTDDITVGATNKFATAAEKTKLGFITVTQGVDLDTIESDTVTNNAKVTNATHTGDATGATALTVVKINGTSLAGLATGILKNTTATGVPSIAVNSDLPAMSATVGGAVPTPPNNTTTFLRGDGTFAIPPSGGSGTFVTGTSILNFGTEQDWTSNTVLSALVTNANLRGASFMPTGTTATSLDDYTLNGVTFNIENIVDGVSFDIRGSAVNNASGNYTINYIITTT